MDEQEIFAEVERRKQRARSLGLTNLVFKLYFEGIRHYATSCQNSPEDVHPDFRSTVAIPARKTGRHGEKEEGVELLVEGAQFRFVFRSRTTTMPDGEDYHSGILSLFVDGQEVFGLECHGTWDEFLGLQWSHHDVDAFVEGSWFEPLVAMNKKVVDWKEQRKAERERSRGLAKAEALRKKFGL